MYIGLPAFSGNTPKATGNLGRNTLRLPGINMWNATFSKSVKVKERFATEFRAEFYNLFNHPNFGYASPSPFLPASGSIQAAVMTSAAGRFLDPRFMDGGARTIRYQLRFSF